MKLLLNAASICGLVFMGVGVVSLWRGTIVGSDLSLAITGLTGGPTVVIATYALSLGARIKSLEAKLAGEPQPAGKS